MAFPWTPRQVAAATVVVVLVGAAFWLLYFLRGALFLLFIAVVLATAVQPLIAWLEQRRFSHPAAVTVVYGLLGALAGGAIAVGAPLLLDQALSLAENLPRLSAQLHQRLLATPNPWVHRLAVAIPMPFATTTPRNAEAEQVLQAATQTVVYLGWGLSAALAGAAILLLAFAWSLQEQRTLRRLLLLVPAQRREAVRDLLTAIEDKVGAYARGQGLVCLAMTGMTLAVYGLMGLPYAVVIAVAAGIFEAVPYFGPILAAVLPLGVAGWTEPAKLPWVLAAVATLQLVESYVLVPRVMDRSVGVHPIITLLALAGFVSLLGVAGAVVAIPMAAILQLLFERYVFDAAAIAPQQPERRDSAAVLHYQAQELLQDVRLWARHKPESAGHADALEEEIEALAREVDQRLEAAIHGATAEGEG